MHFDSYRGAGIVMNFTKRNLVLPASRAVASLNLAENPRARLNYFYYLGRKQRAWHFTELYGERVLMGTFIQGTEVKNVISTYFSATTMINYTLTKRSFIGLGPSWQWNQLAPKVDPQDKSKPDSLELSQYKLNTVGMKIQYQYNSADKVFFPTRGSTMRLEAKFNFDNTVNATLYETLNGVSSQPTLGGQVRNYWQLNLKGQRNISISPRTTLQLVGQAFSTVEASQNKNQFSAYSVGAGDFVSVGGMLNRPRATNFTFVGLVESELLVAQIFTAGANLQRAITKNIYITPAVNLLAAGYDLNNFWSTLPDFKFSKRANNTAFYQVGYGVAAGYMSPIGPIQVSLSSDAQVGKLRLFFGLGFNL